MAFVSRHVGLNASCVLIGLALGLGCGEGRRDFFDDTGGAGSGGAEQGGAGGVDPAGGDAGSETVAGRAGAGVGGSAPASDRSGARLVSGGRVMQSPRYRLIGTMTTGRPASTRSASANYELQGRVAGSP